MDVVSYLLGKKSSGGGGSSGLEYEEGTFVPTENIRRPFIQFAKEHSKMPIYVLITYCEDENPTSTTVEYWSYVDFYQITGSSFKYSDGTTSCYTMVSLGNIYTNPDTVVTSFLYHPSSDKTADNNEYPRYYVNETGFYAGARRNSTSPFLANKTYKWFAIWK
jgi:hypothetical protein